MHHDTRQFRELFGRFATGIAVVLNNDEPSPNGMTVNSLTSVSLDPMLLLFCARNESRSAKQIITAGSFSVNILSQEQKEISDCYAGNGKETKIGYIRKKEFVWIENALAVFCCKVKDCYPGGDHRIIIGEVVDMIELKGAQNPLVYFNGNYRRLG